MFGELINNSLKIKKLEQIQIDYGIQLLLKILLSMLQLDILWIIRILKKLEILNLLT